MKPILLALALPLLLTGCAGTYVGDYGPGYPGYWDGYEYGGPAFIGYSSYDRGYYHHGYHHYDTGYRGGAVAYRGSSHMGGHAFAGNVSHASGRTGGTQGASVSSGRHY